MIRAVPGLSNITVNPGVVGTNFGLAFITLLILIMTAVIFNETLEENEPRLKAMAASVAAPFAAAGAATGGLLGWFKRLPPWAQTAIPVLAALALSAWLYGLENPGTGFNNATLVLFLSYFVAFTLITYAWDGVQAMVCRHYGAPAAVRVFPIGTVVAVFAVILTRATGFQPGLMYGFVAANAIIQPAKLTEDQEGKKAMWSSFALLAICAAAWLLVGPLRTVSEDHSSFWAALPEGIAVGVFVAGLEGLFFQMIPIEFLDGRKLFDWNKPIWLAISLVSGFFFFEAIINDDQQAVSAVGQTRTIITFVVVLCCLAATIGFWLFMRALGPEEGHAGPETAD